MACRLKANMSQQANKAIKSDKIQLAIFVPQILANHILPVIKALIGFH